MGREERKRGSASAFSRLVKFYFINVFQNLRFRPSGNEIGPYDKNVHSGDHFRKSVFSVSGRKANKRKKNCFLKYGDTYGQDRSQLSLESLFFVFETPIIHSVYPSSPSIKKLNKLLFSNVPGRTAYSQEHLKTTTYAKFGG